MEENQLNMTLRLIFCVSENCLETCMRGLQGGKEGKENLYRMDGRWDG
jgi:hypothetical protein